MGENQVTHAVGGNQAVRCRQINPQLPLLGADDFCQEGNARGQNLSGRVGGAEV